MGSGWWRVFRAKHGVRAACRADCHCAQIVIERALRRGTQARWSAARLSPERVVTCKLARIPSKTDQKVTAFLPHAGFACL
jgi:hypothetical protein